MYSTGSFLLVSSLFLVFFTLTPPPFLQQPLHPLLPLPPLPPLRASLAQGDRSAAPLVCYCPHGNHLLPPLSLSYQLISLKYTHVGKHAHVSYAIQSLALVGLVCSTRPCQWYLESPCPAPISVPPSRSVHVSLVGVVAVAKAHYSPKLMASLPVNSVSVSLGSGICPGYCSGGSCVSAYRALKSRRAPVVTVGNAAMSA